MATSTETPRLRLQINPLRCVRFGYCSEFCPEMFGLDDWGYALMHGTVVDPVLADVVRRAATLCPTGAISVGIVAPAEPSSASSRRDRER